MVILLTPHPITPLCLPFFLHPGLGLYFCRSIIEAHGGKIWGENNDDQGATFSFSLPTTTRQ